MARFCQNADHVITKDLSIVPNAELRNTLAKGPSLRMRPTHLRTPRTGVGGRIPTAWDILMHCVEASLDKFINTQEEAHEIAPYVFAPWKNEVLAAARDAIPDGSLTHTEVEEIDGWRYKPAGDLGLSMSALTTLRRMQRRYVFTVADKETGVFCITCRRHWVDTVRADLHSALTYVHAGEGAAAAWQARRNARHELGNAPPLPTTMLRPPAMRESFYLGTMRRHYQYLRARGMVPSRLPRQAAAGGDGTHRDPHLQQAALNHRL